MKKLITLFPLIICLLAFQACDNDFTEINTNPVAAVEGQAELLFGTAILQASGNLLQAEGAELIYASCFVQHFASTAGNWHGNRYVLDVGRNDRFFNEAYKNELKHTTDILRTTQDDPNQSDIHHLARIWRVYILHRITDLYGDVPYSEAGLGFEDNIILPKYDTQESIYLDMLNELEEAATALSNDDENKDWDFLYDGDFKKWKKFAHSLTLRLAMRLTKADEAMAKTWVEKAIQQNNFIDDLNNQAVIRHEVGSELLENSIGGFFQQEENGRMSAAFIDSMKVYNDPRLSILAAPNFKDEYVGLPFGLDGILLKDSIGHSNLDSFSQVNPLLVQLHSPKIILSHAEVELLLAEAALRGWSSGDANDHFKKGVEASIDQWQLFDNSLVADDSLKSVYLNNLDLGNNFEEAMSKIHTQYWITVFLNELEAFANWRRTGHPELTPGQHPSNETGGQIPRRLLYPQKEYSVNGDNLQEAISRQGADDFLTPVWWDEQ